jgi:K+-transporting ATPase KdpF subunit
MSVWLWISLGLALALLVYLVYALLKAEDFA